MDVLEQRRDLAVPFCKEADALAVDSGIKVAMELHQHNLVFNPVTLKRLVDRECDQRRRRAGP
jgi:sugar phosphate isomerase/epimerase